MHMHARTPSRVHNGSDVSEVKFRGSAEAEVSFSKNADADVVAEVME